MEQKNTAPKENYIDIKDLLYLCLARWKWFVISLFVTLSVATINLLRTPSEYTRSASVLIKDDSKGKSISSDLESFSEFGLIQSSSNVNNELVAFKSPALMTEVVERLDLNTSYFIPGRFHNKVAYGKNLPATVKIEGLEDTEIANFKLEINSNNEVKISELVYTAEDEKIEVDKEFQNKLLQPIETPVGKITVNPTPYYVTNTKYTILVNRSTVFATANAFAANFSVALNNEKATVIDLSLKDFSITRAEDVLNMIITVYNENWVKDKNRIAVSTSKFITERLNVIEQELGSVDENISSYKSKNLLPDVAAASNLYLNKSNETSSQLVDLNNQLYMTRYVKEYVEDKKNNKQLLPVNSGIENGSIEKQLTEYNTQLLTRNKLVANSSEQNPLVVDLDNSLKAMKSAISTSIDNQIITLEAQIKSLQKDERITTSQIAANPTQAKYLISVERQQKVKESLYLFLLQKREENELSQAFSAYNTRIITPPHGSMVPTAPTKGKIMMIAFIIGLLIPVLIVFTLENFNTKIRGRKDLEGVQIPFIGEIPLHMHHKKGLFKKQEMVKDEIVVKEGSRNIINEAFRILRTNLEFMVDDNKEANVIVVTSFNPGSGKSFITMNTATSLAIKGKKVLVLDGDLRHASTSSFFNAPKLGISDYLGNKANDLKEIIFQGSKNLDVISVGTIPPNPTELLYRDRFAELINKVKGQYDYIFIDCPPIELVADTQIISKFADRTIFIVRAGLLERCMVQELEKLYEEKKYKNMSLVLNGTEGSGHRYGYKYGYRYGYHYGYGDGYHYGSEE